MDAQWHKNTWAPLLMHCAIWVLFFSMPILLRSYEVEMYNAPPLNHRCLLFQYLALVTDCFWLGLFYLDVYLLIPRLIYRKKYALYILSVLAYLALIFGVQGLFFMVFKPQPDNNNNIAYFLRYNVTPFLLILSAGAAYYMIRDKIRANRLRDDREKSNLQTELAFLRSQISPHFMFNVLNNIVALTRIKSEELEPTVFKLSALMRYMLYEADENSVPLSREVEYLQSYIDLQYQRVGQKLQLNVSMESFNDHFEIAPMLLIPFVENAFKYGYGQIDKPQIDIDLHTEGNTLYFSVRNKYNQFKQDVGEKNSGIGLVNVKRRLNLLYAAEHDLTISQDGREYTVLLSLKMINAPVFSR